MKFYETSYEEYIKSAEQNNLHKKYAPLYKKYSQKKNFYPNLIIYGPSGIGKYTQALLFLKQYSSSQLKYDRKMIVCFNKHDYVYRISDIHYEIDMSILGCNAKLLFHEIYNNIVDILCSNVEKVGFIVCRNFHTIHSELLELFYSYMQITPSSMEIRFILLTECLSFIPLKIQNISTTIQLNRPSKSMYNKYFQANETEITTITNIKDMKTCVTYNQFNNIIENMIQVLHKDEFEFSVLREMIYDLFIYDVSIHNFIWNLTSKLIVTSNLESENIGEIIKYAFEVLQFFNNNYRPIYHIERLCLFMYSHIHNLDE
jgi:Cdc6-like AAA superfamily ATPase